MSIAFIDTISQALFGSVGSTYLVGVIIVLFFLIAFLIVGIPFKYSVMFVTPIILAGGSFGFPQIIVTLAWFAIAGIGIYLVWTTLSER